MSTQETRRPPGRLKYANRVNMVLLRRGIGPSSQRVLAIAGRTSGVMRETPVALVLYGGHRFIVAGYASSAWVKNAPAAGWGTLQRGKATERVRLVEAGLDDSPPILREFARSVRGGRSFLTVKADASDSAFAAASVRHPVFRIDPDSQER